MSYNVSYILGGYSLVSPGPQGLAISTDSGLTWTTLTSVSLILENNDIAIDPYNYSNAVIAGENGILYSQNQGATWNTAGGGYTASGYKKITYSANGVIYAFGEYLAKSTDNGLTFQDLPETAASIYGSPANVSAAFFINDLTGYIGIEDTVYKTINGGVTWSAVNAGLPISSGKTIASISGDSTTIIVAVYDSVYKSVNGGNSFLQVQAIAGAVTSDSISVFRQSSNDYFIVFFANSSISTATDRVYKSTNSGYTWTPYLYVGQDGSGYLNSSSLFYTALRGITFSPGNSGYLTLNGGLTRSPFTGIAYKPLASTIADFPSYTLYNCTNPEVTINTLTDLSAYIRPSVVVRLEEYSGQCWTVGVGLEGIDVFEDVTVDGEPYASCETCIPIYYTLVNCDTEETIYAEPSDALLANDGLVVNIEEETGCWLVDRFQQFTEEILIPVTITQGGYADCVCCLPEPAPEPETFVRTTQQPVKQFYHITDSQCDIRTNTKFADNYYRLFQGLNYGIKNCCDDVNFDKLWIEKELSDYSKINPPDQCVPAPIPATPEECPTAPVAQCTPPTDLSGSGNLN